MTAARILRPTLSELWVFLAVALPALGALIAPMPAVDLAYHLRAGLGMLDGAGIPTTDTWTFTIAGTAWPDQQWWAQLLLAAVYRLGGWSSLAVLRAGLVAATFGLLFLVVRRRAPRFAARPAALLVLAAFLVVAPALALRPQLFAMVLFAATLLVLADRAAHPSRVWLIPLFAILWANLHGTFPLVIGLTGLAWLADVRDRKRVGGRPVQMLAVALVSAIATLVNPLGIDAWTYVVRLATNPTIGSRVSEWRPPGLTDVPGILFWVSVVAVVAFLGLRARRRHAAGTAWLEALPPWPALLTLVAFAGLGAVTGRGLAWWPLVAVFVCAGFLDGARAADRPAGTAAGSAAGSATPRLPRRSRANAVVAGVLIVAAVALLPLWRSTGPAGVPLGTLTYAPQGIAHELTAFENLQSHPATIWNPQRWGSWLEFAVPDARYAVDSRIELFPQSLWADLDTVESGTGDWAAVLDRYAPDLVVVERPTDTALENALVLDPGWACIYQDVDGSIWARSDTVAAGAAVLC